MSYQNEKGSYDSSAPSYNPSTAYTVTGQPVNYPTDYPAAGPGTVQSSYSPSTFQPKACESRTAVRAVELIFALISFSCAAAAIYFKSTTTPPSWNTFLIFVGVMAFILDIAFLIIYVYTDALPSSWEQRLPLGEVIITAIWALFWFAGSIAYAVNLNNYYDTEELVEFATGRAGVAFGFFSCLLWVVSAVLAFQRYRESGGSLGGAPVHYNDL